MHIGVRKLCLVVSNIRQLTLFNRVPAFDIEGDKPNRKENLRNFSAIREPGRRIFLMQNCEVAL